MEPRLGPLVDLFVLHEPGAPASDLTKEALRSAQPLRGIGLHLVRRKDLDDPRVIDAFRRRGVDSLPALLVADRAYVGLGAIRQYCGLGGRGPGGCGPGGCGPGGRERDSRGTGAQPMHRPPRFRGVTEDDAEDDAEDDSAAALEAFYEQEMRAERRGDEVDLWERGPEA